MEPHTTDDIVVANILLQLWNTKSTINNFTSTPSKGNLSNTSGGLITSSVTEEVKGRESADSILRFTPPSTPSDESVSLLVSHFENEYDIYRNDSPPRKKTKDKKISTKKEKTFLCKFEGCEKLYGKSSHLNAHMRKHYDEKSFVCTFTQCSKRFTRSDELRRHTKTHTGERNHACSYCDKKFGRSDHLSKHMMTHQKNTPKERLKKSSKQNATVNKLMKSNTSPTHIYEDSRQALGHSNHPLLMMSCDKHLQEPLQPTTYSKHLHTMSYNKPSKPVVPNIPHSTSTESYTVTVVSNKSSPMKNISYPDYPYEMPMKDEGITQKNVTDPNLQGTLSQFDNREQLHLYFPKT